MNKSVRVERISLICLPLALLFLLAAPRVMHAQSAQDIVRKVVGNELWYSDHDHTRWMYEDDYKSPSKNQVKLVIQTPTGNLSEIIQNYGQTPSAQMHQADLRRMNRTVHDPSYRAQQRQNERHDDQQAQNLLKMLPDAFIWRIDSREGGKIRLSYHPNPNFSPPSMASRVLASMSGTMVVNERQMRLEDLFGRLDKPVEFGWGLLGHLNAGGTFQVIRSEIAPGEWQITGTHVHISGHALFFKDIGDQEDEITKDYHPVPDGVDLEKAQQMLLNGEVARMLGVSGSFVH
jgi:hypothetical protein